MPMTSKQVDDIFAEMIGQDTSTPLKDNQKPPPKPECSGPVTLAEWLNREIEPPDQLMGSWLTTTTRCLLTADTGLGKTMFNMGLGMAATAGKPFLHWQGRRPCRALYIDGEMSKQLFRDRLRCETGRLGAVPETFFPLSHADVKDFAPLNTKTGQEFIDEYIKELGGVDLIFFDNIMSLIPGDMKDEEPWGLALPWIKNLTERKIGQVWIHHTGHDATRGYGTKTREWQMDCVVHFDRVNRDDTDLSFELKFTKARDRTPDNRIDFAATRIAMVNDRWETSAAAVADREKETKATRVARAALDEAIDSLGQAAPASNYIPANVRVVSEQDWRKFAYNMGISTGEERAQQKAFAAAFKALNNSGYIGVWQGLVWKKA